MGTRGRPRDSRTLQAADQQARQHVRTLSADVVSGLDTEDPLSVEVNGEVAGTIWCSLDAAAELAVGWAFMHRFFGMPDEFDGVHVDETHAGVMTRGGMDVAERARAMAYGDHSDRHIPAAPEDVDPAKIEEDILLDLTQEAFQLFRRQGAVDGFAMAAIASSDEMLCVGRDRSVELAVAKVFGWSISNSPDPTAAVLIVDRVVTWPLVEAAVRLGIGVIVTSELPTADAVRLARVTGMTIWGKARARTVGVFADGGAVRRRSDGADTSAG